jgi:hypothetical protein
MGLTPEQLYLNAEGDDSSNTTDTGNNKPKSAALIASAISAIGSVAGNVTAGNAAEAQAQAQANVVQQQMIANSLNKSKNTTAIIVISSVLVVGGLAAFLALKK